MTGERQWKTCILGFDVGSPASKRDAGVLRYIAKLVVVMLGSVTGMKFGVSFDMASNPLLKCPGAQSRWPSMLQPED